MRKRCGRGAWIGVWGAMLVSVPVFADDPPGREVVIMSASPWVGMEPEFKGKFKTGVQRLFTGESPFGVYDPRIEDAKRRLVEEIRRIDRASRKKANWIARVTNIEPFANKYSEPARGETITDYKVHLELPDLSEFWFVVSADPATVEAQTMPVSFEEMHDKFQRVLDTYLYGAGSRVGLTPRVSLASNHFHLGTATAFYKNEIVPVQVLAEDGKTLKTVNLFRPVEEQAGVFRDYAVSLFNNPALAYFADDNYIFTNAPHPTWIPKLHQRLESVIFDWDLNPTSVQDLASAIQNAYVETSPINPAKHHPEKYVFYNMTRTANSSANYRTAHFDQLTIPKTFGSAEELEAFLKKSGLEAFYQQTTEMRGIGGQATLENYVAIMQLYVDRLEYVRRRRLDKSLKIPLLEFGAPYSAEHGANQLMFFVRETYEGLGRSEKEVSAAWKKYARLIRQDSIRAQAVGLRPYDLSLGDLYVRAYRDSWKNRYRENCTWLFQSSMNAMPDSK
ncbi:MAG: hypothetical protein JST04_04700 [Bdellovibrionales bacterium]|nr:hypothetical protein [Bdellovibrionales bacterium]